MFISKNKHLLTNRRTLLHHLYISFIIFYSQVVMKQHTRSYTVEKHTAVVHIRKSKKVQKLTKWD